MVRGSQVLPVSVVIATLGGESLVETIASLNQGERVVDEILVCMPAEHESGSVPKGENVRLVATPCRGQVAQRAYGLALARNPYVVQMDDDVLMSAEVLVMLLQACQKAGPRSAVSPLLKNCETGQYLATYSKSLKGFLRSLVATVVCGAPWGIKRMGRIDPAGIPYAIDRAWCGEHDLVETEWLPGGCVICHREDLVLESYFPFSGKAYSEDVIHSLLWRQRGVRLWIAPRIDCCTYIAPMPSTLASIRADYRAKAYVISLNGGSLLRCQIWFILFIVRRWLPRLHWRRS